jgi:hypothetical protein
VGCQLIHLMKRVDTEEINESVEWNRTTSHSCYFNRRYKVRSSLYCGAVAA